MSAHLQREQPINIKYHRKLATKKKQHLKNKKIIFPFHTKILQKTLKKLMHHGLIHKCIDQRATKRETQIKLT